MMETNAGVYRRDRISLTPPLPPAGRGAILCVEDKLASENRMGCLDLPNTLNKINNQYGCVGVLPGHARRGQGHVQ